MEKVFETLKNLDIEYRAWGEPDPNVLTLEIRLPNTTETRVKAFYKNDENLFNKVMDFIK